MIPRETMQAALELNQQAHRDAVALIREAHAAQLASKDAEIAQLKEAHTNLQDLFTALGADYDVAHDQLAKFMASFNAEQRRAERAEAALAQLRYEAEPTCLCGRGESHPDHGNTDGQHPFALAQMKGWQPIETARQRFSGQPHEWEALIAAWAAEAVIRMRRGDDRARFYAQLAMRFARKAGLLKGGSSS